MAKPCGAFEGKKEMKRGLRRTGMAGMLLEERPCRSLRFGGACPHRSHAPARAAGTCSVPPFVPVPGLLERGFLDVSCN